MVQAEDFDNFTDDFLQEKNPRTIVIVASSKIDDILLQIIGNFLIPKLAKENDQDELLEGDKPLSTFSSRIKLVYRFGFIDKSFYLLLEKIRDIRNMSAHLLYFDISKSPLKEKINNLIKEISTKESFALIKNRFFNDDQFNKIMEIKCSYLTVCAILVVISSKINQLPCNQETMKISQK